MKAKISIGIIVLFVLIQFIPVKKNQDNGAEGMDIFTYYNTDENGAVAAIIKSSCYDCHSNRTAYPWYNNIAPVSLYLAKHVNNGKKHLNFSEWKYMDEAKKEHKIEELIEMIQEDEMPLWSYTLIHRDAKLSVEEKTLFIKFFEGL